MFDLSPLHYVLNCQVLSRFITNFYITFLPRDAMRKRGLCGRPVSVCLSRWWIVPTQLKMSSNFLLFPVATSL